MIPFSWSDYYNRNSIEEQFWVKTGEGNKLWDLFAFVTLENMIQTNQSLKTGKNSLAKEQTDKS